MEKQESGKKVEIINGIVTETSKFINELQEKGTALRAATEAIQASKIDKFFNGLTTIPQAVTEMTESLSTTLSTLASGYGSDPNINPKAKAIFEETSANAKKLAASGITLNPVEVSDDMNEHINDETLGAFKTAVFNFCDTRKPYITKSAEIIKSGITVDTQKIFMQVGSSIETLCNTIARTFNENEDALKSYGLSFEELVKDLNTKTSSLESATSVITKKIKSEDEEW